MLKFVTDRQTVGQTDKPQRVITQTHFVYTREPKRAEGGTRKAEEKQTIGKVDKKAESLYRQKKRISLAQNFQKMGRLFLKKIFKK